MRMTSRFSLIGILALSVAPALHAQTAPAIPGHTGAIVTPETAKDEKKAEDKAGAATKKALTPADNKGPLADLAPGTTVVIRSGSNTTEGIVSKIDRSANEITVRYENKKVEKMVLVEKSSAGARTVEYTNDLQQRVTRYFKPTS
jgi:hypothetical protein